VYFRRPPGTIGACVSRKSLYLCGDTVCNCLWIFQRGTHWGLSSGGDLCGERRLECEAVGALWRCGSCPGRRRAGLVGRAIEGVWKGLAPEVAWGITGTPLQAWDRRA